MTKKSPKAKGAEPGFPAWLLAVLTALLYLPSLSNELTNWDDPDFVTHNPIAALGWQGVFAAFVRVYEGSYYPLTYGVYAVVHALGGSAGMLHGIQLVLFAATVALVPSALRAFGVPTAAGVCAALLWAVHPMRVDSVVWAANLKDTLGAAFIVGSLALYGPGRRWPALAAFVAAMLSKSAFFGVALLFPLIELRRVAGGAAGRNAGASRWEVLKRTGPFLLVAVVTAIVSGTLHLGAGGTTASSTLTQRIATASWTPWWYLGRIVFPLDPRAVYDFPLLGFDDVRFFAALGLWVALGVLAWKVRGLVVPVIAFLVTLAPVSGLVPLRFIVADRYTLFPSLAVFAAVSTWALSRWSLRRVATGCGVLGLVWAPLNVLRQREWHDSVSLWESNARLVSASSTVPMNLAEAYADAGRFEDARQATVALLKTRNDPAVWSQLFWLSGVADRVPPAELSARRDALIQSNFAVPEVLGEAEWCLAHQFLTAASSLLRYSPGLQDNGRAQRMLSAVTRRQGQPAEALDHARRAIALEEPRAQIELAYALADVGRVDEALQETEHAMPDEFSAALLRGAKGYVLVKLGRTNEGRFENEAALESIRRLSAP